MRKRLLVTLAAVVAFIVLIGMIKFVQIKGAIAKGKSFRPPPEAVTTVVADRAQWPATFQAIGSVSAVQGVTVSADLPGMVQSISFQSGTRVRQGQVLARHDSRQEQAQVAAAEAQSHLAQLNLERATKLVGEGAIARAEYDQTAATAKQAEASASAIRATIGRKTIRAPFSGVLGIRQAARGQYLNAGDPIVPLQSLDPIYVDFSLPQQDVAALRVGAPVTASADSMPGTRITGKINAINSVVDPATRNVQAQATFANPSLRLRPGMFVSVEVNVGTSATVIALPASAIDYAPYGNSVFVISTMKGPDGKPYRGVQQRFVKLGITRGDQVAVLTGLAPGDEVVTSGVFKLRNGAAVVVNNQRQPSNNPAPRPENS